ncbi:RNA polymerase sigma factor [uncultured Endozoicomonas sp.]|uniref:RNA polymerase sigma factor n=1 Tax=uncultured Endozoicomonas sp. TaxID=432652 RepID=UPI00262C4ED3|nr:RNA polymerase sigma factor [uncultured Endozoicomonas sp.]
MKDETLLIQQAKGGDAKAFSVLVRHYYHLMRFVAAPIVGESNADEIVQEAWLTVHQKLAEWKDRGSFKAWLLTITANEAKSLYRKQKREVLSESPEENLMAERFQEDGHWRQPPSIWHIEGPEALLNKQELMDCLNHKITVLPEKQRIVFGLKDFSQFSLDEIAECMGETSANVRVLLHRARTRLYAGIERFQETGIC